MPLDATLGPYKLLSLLGSGAMGEVYRARDTRLDRDVALKIIPRDASSDPARRRRFEQEAKSASALNHPNILIVHDIGSHDGYSFIVSELVEGESLRKLLKGGPLAMRKLLDLAIQIADGLAAAHEAGIIHRDLKPENIMVTRDGRVKILDFGLAKAVSEKTEEETDPSFENNDTEPGMVVGTTAYMSPEQARGGSVRFYSDQFSFGLILYEMATGTQPFRRETPLQTLSAILTEEPAPIQTGSPPFRWLITRCLHKEPDHRYHSTVDLLHELENIKDHLSETHSAGSEAWAEPVAAAAVRKRNLSPAFTAAGLTLVALAVGYGLGRWLSPDAGVDLATQRYLPLATGPGIEAQPSWSPNGKTIAYAAEVDGIFQIITRSLGSSMPTQLTRVPQDCLYPFWSPDGARVYYISQWNQAPSLWSVGATGGSPELVIENAAQAAIAADGKTIAVLRRDAADANTHSLWMGSIAGRDLKRYSKAPLADIHALPWSCLRFSPDGKQLLAWVSLWQGKSEVWSLPVDGGQPSQLLRSLQKSPIASEFSWTPDSRSIIFAERSGLSIDSHLRRARLNGSTSIPLTVGTGVELSPALSPDGDKLAFASMRLDYDIVRIPLHGEGMSDVLATGLFEVSPSMAPDNSQYAYVTDRSGQSEIWLRSSTGNLERPIVTQHNFGEDRTANLFDTVFSPDGKRIAYRRAGSDNDAIWISTLTGDPPVQLAREPGDAFQRGPTWSPDGNSIAYFSMRNGKYVILRARVGGLENPVPLAENVGTYPRWSPRGEWIACIGISGGIALLSPDGKTQKSLGQGAWLLHGWSADSTRIIGIRQTEDRRLILASLDVDSRNEQILSRLGAYPAGFTYGAAIGALPYRGFSLSPDGGSFLTSILRPAGDIWMLQRLRGRETE
ncbi:MAG TPA: protein kinase [Bryobacteraceae bacterium]|nr:protein kinase [Bryobacteraceae bacterium]